MTASGMVSVPPRFWQSLSREEVYEIIETGYLNRDQRQRLWRMMDLNGEPPDELKLFINSEDMDAFIAKVMREYGKK